MLTPKTINPALKGTWHIIRVVEGVYGFNLGLIQFVFYVFLYSHLGENSAALEMVIAVFSVNTLFTLILEIPTGALGDYIGRKKTVVLSFVVASISYLFRAAIHFSPLASVSFCFAIISAILNAASYTLFSGTFVSWVVDTTHEMNIPEGYGPILARGKGVMLFGKMLGAAIGVTLFLYDYAYYVFGLASISALTCAIYCAAAMKETSISTFYNGKLLVRQSLTRMKEIINIGFKVVIKSPPLLYITLVGIAFVTVMRVVNALWPIAMKANFGIEKMTGYWMLAVFLGLLSAWFGAKFLEALQNKNSSLHSTIKSRLSLCNWVTVVSLIMGVPIVLLGIANLYHVMTIWLFVGSFVCFNFGYGFLMSGLDILNNDYIPAEHSSERATIASWESMVYEMFLLLLVFPSSGGSGAETTVGWALPASMLIISVIIVNILLRRYEHRTAKAAINIGLTSEVLS